MSDVRGLISTISYVGSSLKSVTRGLVIFLFVRTIATINGERRTFQENKRPRRRPTWNRRIVQPPANQVQSTKTLYYGYFVGANQPNGKRLRVTSRHSVIFVAPLPLPRLCSALEWQIFSPSYDILWQPKPLGAIGPRI